MNKLFSTPLFLLLCIASFAQIPTGSKLWLKADAGVTVTSGALAGNPVIRFKVGEIGNTLLNL